MTSLVYVPGHVFAIVEGRIYDCAGGAYFGAPIITIFVPPESCAR